MKNKHVENLQPVQSNNLENDALNALVSLGIARNAGYTAIQKALKHDSTLTLEDLIKLALKNI
jgi:Holliday junction DNA helicase RuvA